MKRIAITAALAAALALPVVAEAQGGPGFLFNRPRVSFGIRTGLTLPRASSDLFEQARADLTLNTWDFASPYFGGELAVRASERWDVALAVGGGQSRSRSEYRDWVDQDQLAIEQETTLQTVSATVGGKYYFGDRGRSIGRFAWVPSTLSPFVGGGVGGVWYVFEQVGDFVDFQTLEVYYDALETRGGGATAYATGGVDLSLGKQFFLTGEARYSLASGGVQGSYIGFDRIDLSGLQLLAGISIRF